MLVLSLFSLVLSLVLSPTSQAAGRLACSSRDLKRQDCRLRLGEHNIRLLPATIARDDGVWHTVDDMPLKGEGIVWEKIRFEKVGSRSLLQFWIWDKGTGQAQVQSLHWYVADIRKDKMKLLAEGIVRRRRVKDAKGEFIYDAYESHGLKPEKNGSITWSLGSQSKVLSPESE